MEPSPRQTNRPHKDGDVLHPARCIFIRPVARPGSACPWIVLGRVSTRYRRLPDKREVYTTMNRLIEIERCSKCPNHYMQPVQYDTEYKYFCILLNTEVDATSYPPPDDCPLPRAGWIPVEEALPEGEGEFLVFSEGAMMMSCRFKDDSGYHWGWLLPGQDVTHWRPLPEPPKQEERK